MNWLTFFYALDLFFYGLVIALIAVFVVFGISILYKKLYKRPIISLRLNREVGWTKEKHFRGEDASDPNQDFHEVHTYFKIVWKFKIILKNASRSNAYKVKLLQLRDNGNFELPNGKIDEELVFEFNLKEDIPFTYDKTVRVKRRDQNKYFTGLPEEHNDLILLLEYNDKNKKIFYRKYSFSNDKTIDTSMSEEDLEKWVYL